MKKSNIKYWEIDNSCKNHKKKENFVDEVEFFYRKGRE